MPASLNATPRPVLPAGLGGLLLCVIAAGLLAAPAVPRTQAQTQPQQFIYILRVAPAFHAAQAWTDRESAIVSRHFKRLARAAHDGQVILAGRSSEPLDTTFGVVIFEAEDEPAARRFMQADPAVAEGLMWATLHPYTVALQRRARAD